LQIEKLTKQQDTTKRSNAIELKAAKQRAKEMFDQMLAKRIDACTKAYAEEFEILATQFTGAVKEIATLKNRVNELETLLHNQEELLSQYQSMVESVGRDCLIRDKGQDLT
jgi:hypothetical protein